MAEGGKEREGGQRRGEGGVRRLLQASVGSIALRSSLAYPKHSLVPSVLTSESYACIGGRERRLPCDVRTTQFGDRGYLYILLDFKNEYVGAFLFFARMCVSSIVPTFQHTPSRSAPRRS